MISERLLQLIEYKGFTINSFEDEIQVGRSTILKSIRGKRALSSNVLEKIMFVFPDVNANWLISGDGNMLKINKGVVNNELSLDREKLNSKDVLPFNLSKVPYYHDIPVSGNVAPMHNDYPEIPSEYISLPFGEDIDFFAPVIGDSMQGKFDSGSIIGYKEVKDFRLIMWGKPHLVVTPEYRTIKYLHRSEKEGYAVLKSANEYYQDYEIPMEAILKLYRVRAAINLFE